MRTIVAALAALALIAGCGEDDDAQPASAALADLTVEIDRDGEGGQEPRTVTVRCDAPEDSAVCRALAQVKPETFEPVSRGVACTQQYGGPETATITGTLRGEQVDAEFSRNNGCEISRWQDAAAFLDAAG